VEEWMVVPEQDVTDKDTDEKLPGKSKKDLVWLRDHLQNAGRFTFILTRVMKRKLLPAISELQTALAAHAVTYGSPGNYTPNSTQYEIFVTIRRLLDELEELQRQLPKMLELSQSVLKLSKQV
jgi:hypothetical protein